MNAVLHLNLHREYFAAIVERTKKIEYRERTPYWKTRLENRQYDAIQFRNGYATDAPEMLVEFAACGESKKMASRVMQSSLGKFFKSNAGEN